MNLLAAVKTGATPEIRGITELAARCGGLSVLCGGGTYRPLPVENGNLCIQVAAAIDAAMNAPYAGGEGEGIPFWRHRIVGYNHW